VHSAEQLVDMLRARGKKVTAQRVLIYRALVDERIHPTAEQIHSLTTVYSALNDLVEMGEARRFDAGDGSVHYDPEMRPHAELVCVECGRIDDAPFERSAKRMPAEVEGYRILRRTELLHGVCPACQAGLDAAPVTAD